MSDKRNKKCIHGNDWNVCKGQCTHTVIANNGTAIYNCILEKDHKGSHEITLKVVLTVGV